MRLGIYIRLAGFRQMGIALIIFLAINFAVFISVLLCPALVEWLWLSADRPWGILTSAFTHAELSHLVSNLHGFVFAAILFIMVNMIDRRKIRRRKSKAFFIIAFFAGIGANILEYPLALASPGDYSWGASGVVYGAFGVLMASAVLTFPAHLKIISKDRWRMAKRRKSRKWLLYDRKSLRALSSVFSVALLISFLFLIIFDTGTFLSVGPGVDVFAHALGFFLGFLGFTLTRRFARYSSK